MNGVKIGMNNYYETSAQEPNNPKGPPQGVYRVLRVMLEEFKRRYALRPSSPQ